MTDKPTTTAPPFIHGLGWMELGTVLADAQGAPETEAKADHIRNTIDDGDGGNQRFLEMRDFAYSQETRLRQSSAELEKVKAELAAARASRQVTEESLAEADSALTSRELLAFFFSNAEDYGKPGAILRIAPCVKMSDIDDALATVTIEEHRELEERMRNLATLHQEQTAVVAGLNDIITLQASRLHRFDAVLSAWRDRPGRTDRHAPDHPSARSERR